MAKKEDIVMSWSGGKDSSYALHQILKEGKFNVKYLLTNTNLKLVHDLMKKELELRKKQITREWCEIIQNIGEKK